MKRISLFRAITAGLLLVVACGPQAQPTLTAAPKPTEAPKPVATAQPRPTPKPAATRPAVMPTPQLKPTGTGDPMKIKIVTSFPHRGSSQGQADSIVFAVRMALEEVGNKAGGFDLEIVQKDDSDGTNWKDEIEVGIANQAVNDPDVMAYIGTYNSGAAKHSIPINNRANLVHISPANTYPGLTKPGTGESNEPQVYQPSGIPNYVRVTPADDLQGEVGAIWAKELGVNSVYVLDDTELYGHGLAVIFAKEVKRLGIEVKNPGGIPEGIDAKAKDYKALAMKIKALRPDLIYYGGITSNNAPKLWKDLREILGKEVKLMGPDGIAEESFIKETGAAAEGTYVTFPGLPADKLTGDGAEFYKRYKAKFNSEPEVFAVMGYEAARVVIAAINKVGKKDRTAILQAVLETKNFSGPLGTWSFDANGDTTLTTMTGAVVNTKTVKFDFVKELKVP